MINLTKLLCNYSSYGDGLRYKPNTNSKARRPIVVWNATRRCNLSCIHCYSDSRNERYSGELTTDEAQKMVRYLAAFKVPVLLFSGGEPLLRKDIFGLNELARKLKIRTVISTNGTLITRKAAFRIKEAGFDYVGVSLDGIGKRNDRFRGVDGTFSRALSAIRNLVEVRQKVGLRFTITRHNYIDIPGILKLAENENIDRICFYHLVYAGRGNSMAKDDLTHSRMRACIDMLCDRVMSWDEMGIKKEVLTVDNHSDGPYLYLKVRKQDPRKAKIILKLLRYNGGNSSGIGIANIDSQGLVHADQFWQDYSFGSVRQKAFGDIWQDTSDELMRRLKNRKPYLKGRCGTCGFLDICNGNFRARAKAYYRDAWQEDPACYLRDEEIIPKISRS